MKHTITLAGEAFRLRPVDVPDARFIVDLRSDLGRTKYLHPISMHVEDQVVYIQEYFKRPDDYYFIIESIGNTEPQGTISIYNIDHDRNCGEFGRWIVLHGSLASVESVLLLYRISFNILKLDSVFARTIADNKQTVSFHDSCGLRRVSRLKDHFTIGNNTYDAIEHCVSREEWVRVEQILAEKAAMIARRMVR